MGRGSSWSSLDLGTLESDVSSGKLAGAIAKDRGWPSSSVRQSVAALKPEDAAPRLCRPRLCRWQATASDTGALGRNSLHIVSYLQLKGHPLSALASVGDPCRAPSSRTATSVIVAQSPRRCWRGCLDVESAPRGRSPRVRGWIWPQR